MIAKLALFFQCITFGVQIKRCYMNDYNNPHNCTIHTGIYYNAITCIALTPSLPSILENLTRPPDSFFYKNPCAHVLYTPIIVHIRRG